VQGGDYQGGGGAEFTLARCRAGGGGVEKCYSGGVGGDGQHGMNSHLHLRTPRENQHIKSIVKGEAERSVSANAIHI